jgi:hypothetical protein
MDKGFVTGQGFEFVESVWLGLSITASVPFFGDGWLGLLSPPSFDAVSVSPCFLEQHFPTTTGIFAQQKGYR